jgi:1-deoxy-D-xylulose-5-phosphate reductoisomerase
LEVIRRLSGRFNVVGLSAHSSIDKLLEQAQEFQPNWVVVTDVQELAELNKPLLDKTSIHGGGEHLEMLAGSSDVDIVVAAIVGSAGLPSTMAAIRAGKRIALANKETLVMAGDQVMRLAAETGAEILPVDSEHSAVFQAIQCGQRNEVERIILTASGGPFRDFSQAEMESVTIEQTLAHPTWQMGRKITVDSATMMNKALELIEARWLFDIPAERLGVMIHPQSIVHSLVEFRDGSVITQMSPPDMKLPIQYALTYPDRIEGPATRVNWDEPATHDFFPPDLERFPALEMGFEVASRGGTTGAVLNAANEAAVEAFLHGEIGFTDITTACRKILDNHHFEPQPSLESLMKIDAWAREEIAKWICA